MDTKNEISRSAFLLFIAKGFTDVSVNDIITRVGITKGGFYHYFKSKDDLIRHVLHFYVCNYFDSAFQIAESAENEGAAAGLKLKLFYERILSYDAYLSDMLADEGVDFQNFYFLLMEGIKKYPFLFAFRKKLQEQIRTLITQALAEGRQRGAFNKPWDDDKIATELLARSEGAVFLKVLDSNIQLKKEVESAFNWLWEICSV